VERVEPGPEPSALIRLRELILRGALQPGQRLLELELAERLNLSRTPIRQALPALALEGLLVRVGQRGYAVRSFTVAESLAALHLRAVIEGHAARLAVMEGRGRQLAADLQPLLDDGDAMLATDGTVEAIEDAYGRMNARFHALVVDSGGDLLQSLVARCNVVPFASPGVVAFEQRSAHEVVDELRYAHRQHHAIVDALRSGDPLRVEMLFREHATAQENSMGRPGMLPAPDVMPAAVAGRRRRPKNGAALRSVAS